MGQSEIGLEPDRGKLVELVGELPLAAHQADIPAIEVDIVEMADDEALVEALAGLALRPVRANCFHEGGEHVMCDATLVLPVQVEGAVGEIGALADIGDLEPAEACILDQFRRRDHQLSAGHLRAGQFRRDFELGPHGFGQAEAGGCGSRLA